VVVSKLLYLFSTVLSSKLSKGIGHNSYGEPAWPNDILYIFPVVIYGFIACILGLSSYEPLGLDLRANPFATPYVILPEWYFFPTLNLLRVLPDKLVGVLSLASIPILFLAIPFVENMSRYQNPFRRPIKHKVTTLVR